MPPAGGRVAAVESEAGRRRRHRVGIATRRLGLTVLLLTVWASPVCVPGPRGGADRTDPDTPEAASRATTRAPAAGTLTILEPDTRILVPEAYELANVVIAVSRYGRESPHAVLREGGYYERVIDRFLPHADHPLVADLSPLLESSYRNYYGFRENAFSYRLGSGGLAHAGTHRNIWTPDLFTARLEALDDFVRVTGFRDFYAAEEAFYRRQIDRYGELVDLAAMGRWLHARFPGRVMDRYTVVFSPLILGSHSTRNFHVGGEREAVMFVSGPGASEDGEPAILRGLHERVVFTEIDHNYVNPVTARHRADVTAAVGEFRAWNESDGYASAELTFNEYMTWAVFCLYALDRYTDAALDEVVSRTERQMQKRRGFVRFRDFNRELMRLYRQRRPQTVEELYPPILDWMARR